MTAAQLICDHDFLFDGLPSGDMESVCIDCGITLRQALQLLISELECEIEMRKRVN